GWVQGRDSGMGRWPNRGGKYVAKAGRRPRPRRALPAALAMDELQALKSGTARTTTSGELGLLAATRAAALVTLPARRCVLDGQRVVRGTEAVSVGRGTASAIAAPNVLARQA